MSPHTHIASPCVTYVYAHPSINSAFGLGSLKNRRISGCVFSPVTSSLHVKHKTSVFWVKAQSYTTKIGKKGRYLHVSGCTLSTMTGTIFLYYTAVSECDTWHWVTCRGWKDGHVITKFSRIFGYLFFLPMYSTALVGSATNCVRRRFLITQFLSSKLWIKSVTPFQIRDNLTALFPYLCVNF